jgi:hypothetical protein
VDDNRTNLLTGKKALSEDYYGIDRSLRRENAGSAGMAPEEFPFVVPASGV